MKFPHLSFQGEQLVHFHTIYMPEEFGIMNRWKHVDEKSLTMLYLVITPLSPLSERLNVATSRNCKRCTAEPVINYTHYYVILLGQA